ncbi:hypothetical protein [Streptomyces sp. NPDC000405]
MGYFMYDVMGATVESPDMETMRRVLDGLVGADGEHADVSLSHESGWCLSVFADGLVVWENAEDDAVVPGEMRGIGREEVLELLGLLTAGDIAAVQAFPWSG